MIKIAMIYYLAIRVNESKLVSPKHVFFSHEIIFQLNSLEQNQIAQLFQLFAISNIKLSKNLDFFGLILLLSGDLELNPGPINNICHHCTNPVDKRGLHCPTCNIWIHKKCNAFVIFENNLCKVCKEPSTSLLFEELPFNGFEDIEELYNSTFLDPINYETQENDLDLNKNDWDIFKEKGLLFLHLNVNSLLPKIEEIRDLAEKTDASVIGISESKIYKSITDQEINIIGYNILRADRNRNGGGVVCYVKNNISYNRNFELSKNIENITIDIFLPKTKPIRVVIIYRPPKQLDFFEKFTDSLSICELDNIELYILGDFNVNLLFENQYILSKRFKHLIDAKARQYLLKIHLEIVRLLDFFN